MRLTNKLKWCISIVEALCIDNKNLTDKSNEDQRISLKLHNCFIVKIYIFCFFIFRPSVWHQNTESSVNHFSWRSNKKWGYTKDMKMNGLETIVGQSSSAHFLQILLISILTSYLVLRCAKLSLPLSSVEVCTKSYWIF